MTITLGNSFLADDANVPSLLSLPMLGWCGVADPIYKATRSRILSKANPYFYAGTAASGIGSPHTPPDQIWPIALAVQNQLTVENLALTFSVYPSLSGSITESGRQLMQHDDLD